MTDRELLEAAAKAAGVTMSMTTNDLLWYLTEAVWWDTSYGNSYGYGRGYSYGNGYGDGYGRGYGYNI